MRAKKIFRDSANLWFVGLLTVQFCAGLVYALDAERVHDSGEEIRVKADSIWAFHRDDSAVQINMPAVNSPHSEGACPEADAVFKSKSEYVPYWKKAECPVEFRKGGDGFWRAAAYGKNANPETGFVLDLKLLGVNKTRYDETLKKRVPLQPPQAAFKFEIRKYYTSRHDGKKLSEFIEKAQKEKLPVTVVLRRAHGVLAIGGLYIGESPIEEIIEKLSTPMPPPQGATSNGKNSAK